LLTDNSQSGRHINGFWYKVTWHNQYVQNVTYLLTYLLTYLFSYLLTYTYLLINLRTYLPTYWLTYLLTYSLTYLITYFLNYLLTYSLTHSPTHSTQNSSSWKANRFAASQEILHILWNPKVYHRIIKCPPPVRIPNRLDLVHTPVYNSLKIGFNIILPSTPGSPKWSIFLRFLHQKPANAFQGRKIFSHC
jgi:hypothetical protein